MVNGLFALFAYLEICIGERLKFKMGQVLTFFLFQFLGIVFWTEVKAQANVPDMYAPKHVEQRPWTDTLTNGSVPIEIKPRVPFHFMQLTFRDFQNNCDGQCFYHSGDSAKPECDPKKKDCNLIASVARHGANQCVFMGKAMGSRLNNTICSSDQFYTISLIRTINTRSCKTLWYFDKKMPCVPSEFLAISFINETGTPGLNDIDRWYVCVAGEQVVTLWENALKEATQLNETSPYKYSAPGVIATRMELDRRMTTFSCRFIISAQEMSKDSLSSVKFPLKTTGGPDIKVKMAQGRVLRRVIPEEFIPHSLHSHVNTHTSDAHTLESSQHEHTEAEYFKAQQGLIRPEFKSTEKETQTLVVDKFTGPSEDTIQFSKLIVQPVTVLPVPSKSEDNSSVHTIRTQVDRCDDPKEHVVCFAPNQQRNCIYRQRCPVMLIIEEIHGTGKALSTIKIQLISFQNPGDTLKKVVRPLTWAAVGFSKDSRMGDDIVIACQIIGDEMDIVVSWNVEHANAFNRTMNQNLIFNKKAIKYFRRTTTDTFICEWQMNWKFDVDITEYPGTKKETDPTDPTKLKKVLVHFDLNSTEGTFILLSTGNNIYMDGRMAYHYFRQTLNEQFYASSIHYNFSQPSTLPIAFMYYLLLFFVLYNY